jgi:hypothetical protein
MYVCRPQSEVTGADPLTVTGTPYESVFVSYSHKDAGRAMDGWAHHAGVKLDFIRPGRSVQNGFIESFNVLISALFFWVFIIVPR